MDTPAGAGPEEKTLPVCPLFGERSVTILDVMSYSVLERPKSGQNGHFFDRYNQTSLICLGFLEDVPYAIKMRC